ncbi:hypothetical protein TREMEDRAFT_71991 [Tremella mesenterica DSM 1558]|uniref:uncharacterized protein n=1 Tax=Tremella mesenterica (strain ATCC 24925 / CBS 8224 / DSM 1558 / NBRC 9311 / NRRL Y-6157 / RJB 2259-6 / UBC 559-6) TaxID=578456 RepID=UPI0003F49450|nr:uncharacterized protein TREMEDRAFT_71991 [Tremella mesenterica DSM 1558]EIW68419.1 hypothetical protein TREMEDRAFT_71991 [Tremella mesenterica DSM 1558]
MPTHCLLVSDLLHDFPIHHEISVPSVLVGSYPSAVDVRIDQEEIDNRKSDRMKLEELEEATSLVLVLEKVINLLPLLEPLYRQRQLYHRYLINLEQLEQPKYLVHRQQSINLQYSVPQ